MHEPSDDAYQRIREKRLRIFAALGVIFCLVILIGGYFLQQSLHASDASSGGDQSVQTGATSPGTGQEPRQK